MRKVIFAILFFYSTTAGAQYKKPYFNTLNVANGLPEANVRFSLQDRYGYIWLGTQNGLVRYDGYKLKPYSMPGHDGRDIVNSSINYIFEDNDQKLWIHTRTEGFYYFDRTKDVFVRQIWNDKSTDSLVKKVGTVFYWKEDKEPHVYWIAAHQFLEPVPFKILRFNAKNNTVEVFSAAAKGKYFIPARQTIDIRQDANGKIWLVADSLLSYFDNSSRAFKPWFVLPDNTKGDLFESFQPDPVDADILWMNTYDPAIAANPLQTPHVMRIFQLNTKTKQYKTILPDAPQPGSLPSSGRQIYKDSLKRVWVSTEKGLSLYNRKDATFTNYPVSFFNADIIAVLAADKEGNLWIGGNFEGLYFLNIKSGIVALYKGNNNVGELPRSAGINQLWFDKSGTIWVSTPFSGISFLNRQKSLFAPIPISPGLLPVAESNKLSSYTICGKQGDSICYINDTAGLYAWHSRTNRYDRIDLKNRNAYRRIVRVVNGNDGTIWIASNGEGLYNYNSRTKAVINYTQAANDSLSLNNMINCLAANKDGGLWIGTSVQGILSFNKKTGKFTRYPFLINDGTMSANNTLDDRTVIFMDFDSDGILWIGTNLGGLNRFDTQTGKFTSYLNRERGFTCVVSIMEDSRKRLWVGTYLSGLFLFDRKTGSFNRFSEKNGLLCNNSAGIAEDAEGNIWSISERGMSRLNPAKSTITNFSEFKVDNRGFINYKDAEGNFHFTSKNGLVSFNPLELNNNRIPPSVIIESVSYHNANATSTADTVLFTEGRSDITLAYNENKISFQYVALHFADAANNQYAYQLEGYDKAWVQAGTQRTATYTNLSSGTYIFKVKASNSDGVWNETGAHFTIIILPPWWKTWWAYTLYALLFLGALRVFSKWRERRLRSEKENLQVKVEERTSELKRSLENLKVTQSQLIQSEKMASLGELTAGIAHEIQNPLNFVNNFSEVSNELISELVDEMDKGNTNEVKTIAKDVQQNLEKILHHGKRADAIVKGMLQHSRTGSAQKEPTDLNALAEEYLRLSYHGLKAKDHAFNASFHFQPDETLPEVAVVPQDMGRVLLNLINNAFQACAEKNRSAMNGNGEKPSVSVSTRKRDNMVEIKVTDNGPGIPEAIRDKIFQPFFTTKPTGQGTGLGLSLSYDIVKAHGGEMKVETKDGEGSKFTVQLPIL